MKYRLPICAVLASQSRRLGPGGFARADRDRQHGASAQTSPLQVSDKPVARVNGAVLTDRDLLREMYTIFPTRSSTTVSPRRRKRRFVRARWR